MADFSPAYPDVNGAETSYCSIELMLGPGVRLVGVQDVNYKSPGEIPMVRGLSANDIGRTRGKVTNEGDLTLLKKEWDKILPILTQGGAVGFMETVIPAVTVTYSEPSAPQLTTTDILGHVRFHSPEKSNSEGTDPSKVKLSMSIMWIKYNGIYQAMRSGLPGLL